MFRIPVKPFAVLLFSLLLSWTVGLFTEAQQGLLLPAPPEGKTVYDEWVAKLEIPVVEGVSIKDLRKVEVRPWQETGGRAAYFRLAGSQFIDARVHEIPAGGSLKAERHLHEENIFILAGKGYTVLQQEGRRPQQIDWQQDTAFSIPLNVRHQHFNEDNTKPARFFAITNFPFTFNTYENVEFIGAVQYPFRDRYNAEEEFLKLNKHLGGRQQAMNVIPNVKELELYLYESRGVGATSMNVSQAGNTMVGGAGLSEIPVGRYHRAHAHLNEAMIYIADGEGYSLLWKDKENFKNRQKLDWREGSLLGVPKLWYHQHFNIGDKPARFVRYTTNRYLARMGTNIESPDMPYEEEDPEVEEIYRNSSKVIDPVMEEIWQKAREAGK